jgi:hypothetical protein
MSPPKMVWSKRFKNSKKSPRSLTPSRLMSEMQVERY